MLLDPLGKTDHLLQGAQGLAKVAADLVKLADDAPAPAYSLTGQLYLSASGWILLSVPNDLVRGVFAAMDEPGVELPPGPDGKLNAHISVMRPEELEKVGGAAKITERGKRFRYTLGRLVSVRPAGWGEMAKVWFVKVHSPELMDLRTSYGLTPRPNDNKFDFHITCAVRRKAVLARTEVSKAAADSIYEDALLSTSPEWDSSQGLVGNISQHLNRVREAGDSRIRQLQNDERFKSQLDPNYASQRMLDYVHGRRGDVPANPLDRVLYAIPKQAASVRMTSFSIMRNDEPLVEISVTSRGDEEESSLPFEMYPFDPEEDDKSTQDDQPLVAVDLEDIDPESAGIPRDGIKDLAEILRDLGCLVIIQTRRGDRQRLVDWLEEHEIPYDYLDDLSESSEPDEESAE